MKTKMYILAKNTVPIGIAVNGIAHASLKCYLAFQNKPDMIEWKDTSFHKFTCSVTEKEFEYAKQFSDFVVVTESTLDKAEICLAFCPRQEWPKCFAFYRPFGKDLVRQPLDKPDQLW